VSESRKLERKENNITEGESHLLIAFTSHLLERALK